MASAAGQLLMGLISGIFMVLGWPFRFAFSTSWRVTTFLLALGEPCDGGRGAPERPERSFSGPPGPSIQ